jgi:hypothetical protein
MQSNRPTNVDHALGRFLQTKFANESRRSFLSRLTRYAFGASGVTLAARAFLEVRQVGAGPVDGDSWTYCGMNGRPCNSDCPKPGTGGYPAGTMGSSWTQCCRDPRCNAWFPCNYYDFCATTEPNLEACDSRRIPSGYPSWCGNATLAYWCTDISCSGNTDGYANAADCTATIPPVSRC